MLEGGIRKVKCQLLGLILPTRLKQLASACDGQDDRRRDGRCEVCAALRQGELRFKYLDAAQLVKHAFGLITEGGRLGRLPILYYIFAEPSMRAGQNISGKQHARHREEIATFASAVADDEVAFASASYREWMDGWDDQGELADHAKSLRLTFGL